MPKGWKYKHGKNGKTRGYDRDRCKHTLCPHNDNLEYRDCAIESIPAACGKIHPTTGKLKRGN